jgi:hypothetical protein
MEKKGFTHSFVRFSQSFLPALFAINPPSSLGPQEILPVRIIQKNVLPPVATAHHMVNGPVTFHSHFDRHGNSFTRSLDHSQAK